MGRELFTLGFLLRLGILLTTVYVCIHVYLETGGRKTPAPLALERPIQSKQNLGQQSRTKRVSADTEEQDRSVKRRISYVRTLKKDGPAKKRDESKEAPSPPLRPHRKVC